jgi:hypothetical protein
MCIDVRAASERHDTRFALVRRTSSWCGATRIPVQQHAVTVHTVDKNIRPQKQQQQEHPLSWFVTNHPLDQYLPRAAPKHTPTPSRFSLGSYPHSSSPWFCGRDVHWWHFVGSCCCLMTTSEAICKLAEFEAVCVVLINRRFWGSRWHHKTCMQTKLVTLCEQGWEGIQTSVCGLYGHVILWLFGGV